MAWIGVCLVFAAVIGVLPPMNFHATGSEAVLEGARKEGKLVVYTSMTVD